MLLGLRTSNALASLLQQSVEFGLLSFDALDLRAQLGSGGLHRLLLVDLFVDESLQLDDLLAHEVARLVALAYRAVRFDEVASCGVARLLHHLQLHLQFGHFAQRRLALALQVVDNVLQVLRVLLVRDAAERNIYNK